MTAGRKELNCLHQLDQCISVLIHYPKGAPLASPFLRHKLPRVRTLMILTLSAAITALPVRAAETEVARRANRVEADVQQSPRPDDLGFATRIQRSYDRNFGDIDNAGQLRNHSDTDLKRHWEAAETAIFYTSAAHVTASAQRVLGEMERRGLADNRARSRLFNALLSAGRFDAARSFAARHTDSGLPQVPAFLDTDPGLPSAWRFSKDGNTLTRTGIDLQPLQIIVAAGCHFSADAANDIANDPVLGPVFTRHARWLSLPPGNEDLDALREWNRTHPRTPMLAIRNRAEWAVIPKWNMPTFAIIQGGKLIDSTRGWRSGDPEFRNKLVSMLRRAGLLQAGTD